MSVVRCAGCAARADVARTDDVRPWLGAVFGLLNFLDLRKAGWTYEGAVWWCLYCTRRRRLIRLVPAEGSDVTAPSPPTGAKK